MREELRDPRESATAELIERMTSRIVNTLVICAGIIGLAVYARPGPPRYDVVATSDGRIVRINRDNGSVVSCDAQRCSIVHLSGEDLDHVREGDRSRGSGQPALPAPEPPAAPQPQPQQQPSQPQEPSQPQPSQR